jgi:N6-adenosine-specific RNA methylase IME4
VTVVGAANHYPVSETAHKAEEIHERTRDRFRTAAKDCVLFMWATVPYLHVAMKVMELRGFTYVSNYVWDKIQPGTGHWSRNRHEHLLIGVKGKIPCPAPGEQWDSLLSIKRGKHSAKPEDFLEMIEQYFPNLPKIELHRRGPSRPGWDCWGNEAEAAEAAE